MKKTSSTEKIRRPNIGLRQATRLCQCSRQDLLKFISEGLPIILGSAQSFWKASNQLNDHPREENILIKYAEEEATKILILMDAVRCPPNLINSKLKVIIRWFYNHLARLIYAESISWKPMHLAQLREYVDDFRASHYLEGDMAEYIMPNWALYERESALYADIELYSDDQIGWNIPHRQKNYTRRLLGSFPPPSLRLSEAMEQLGLFTLKGLEATTDIWGSLEYRDQENHHDGDLLTEQLLERLHTEGLILNTATDEHVKTLYEYWQIPMYNLDFSLKHVSVDDLRSEQERKLWSSAL